MSNRVKLRVNATILYAYIEPRRMRGSRTARIACQSGVRRPWLRYAVIQTVMIRVGRSVRLSRVTVHVVGWAWTRREAERIVAELREIAS